MKTIIAITITALAAATITACDGVDLVGPAAESCTTAPLFTVSPVEMRDLELVTVVGSLGAPGHTLPTPQVGFYLETEGAVVRAPSDMQIIAIRRTTYVRSPNRQGKQDYTTEFQVCKQIGGWFGHLTTLSSAIPITGGWKECERYDTSIETVESCTAKLKGVTVTAGQQIGTSGLSKSLGLMGLDFGLTDSRVDNGYVANWRHSDPVRRAICSWDRFEPTVREQLYGKLKDPGRTTAVPSGEPRCGTMQVDVANTARGVWAPPTATSPLQGNETAYLTLANYPYRPVDQLALSLGPDILGAGVAVVARGSATGRVNRPFELVTADGLVYCYGPDLRSPWLSWLVSMSGPSALSIKKVENFVASTCESPPSTWSMTGAVNFVR
ncbi:MAG: hypothetical protein IT353_09055 [Gemmatimonadaceae bacterium]|jgi:hypothetical protein|nr:hypothetical protein [Gemmatimonadaceae bacterium]